MKRAISLILIFALCSSLFATPIKFEYEPYKEEEFPLWTVELRRAESIFFGSFVITLPLTAACYALAESLGAQMPESEAWLFGQQALIASGVSLSIALTDWIIGKVST